ncbi:MAG: helix-turn-helix domain-containing protein [Novosphingobium sp.]|nr:helix-turn-helix domain-containing protein [Novosphingobium sp.]
MTAPAMPDTPAKPVRPAKPAPAVLPLYIGVSDRDLLLSLGFPSPSTLFEAISDGKLIGFKVGRKTVVKVDELIRWIESNPRTDANRSSKGRSRSA